MNKEQTTEVITLLYEMGFIVEWVDAKAETFLIRAIPARTS